MISVPTFGGMSPAEQRSRLLEILFVVIGGVAVSVMILVPKASLFVVAACVVLWFLRAFGNALCGRPDGMLLLWVAFFPLGGYFASFPRQQSVVTLDRVVVVLAFVGLLFARSGTLTPVPKALRQAALACLAFVAVASLTLGNESNPLNGARVLLDGFVVPILLGWYVVARLDVRARLSTLHAGVCISSIVSATVAFAEIVMRQDLLPLGAPAVPYEGIVRPNGPFESNDTLALIGAVSIFLVLFLRASLGPKLSTGRRILHLIGLAAAVGMAVMPLFRSVGITLLLILIIDTVWEQRASRRIWRVTLIAASVGLLFMVAVFAPEVFEDRSSAGNIYGRIAQSDQSLRVFKEHPARGVGFMCFHDYVVGEPRYVATYEGVTSLDWPHSNLLQVLSETGVLGFVPYLMVQVLLFKAFWQLRRASSDGPLVWKYFLYVFLSYWITGISEGSGYAPLNLWFVFAIAIFCKYVLTAPQLTQPGETYVLDEAFGAPAHVF